MKSVATSQRVIQTARLNIVEFNETHLTDRYVGWLNDPQVVRYSEQRHHMPHTLASCREYMESFPGTPHRFWAVEEASLGHIGNLNAYVDEPNLTADVGIMLGETRARGLGYGVEAFDAVCAWMLTEGNMRKVTAGAMAENRAMIRIMERLGMQPDGVRRGHYLLDGREVDVVHMALFQQGLDRTKQYYTLLESSRS